MAFKSESARERSVGGRPPKFNEASRPVTVTLPDRILSALRAVSPDRAVAITKCVEAVLGEGERARKSVELMEILPGKALIVIGPCKSLSKIAWLKLVEITPARYLLVLPSGKPIESLELEVQDLLEHHLEEVGDDRGLLEELRRLISHRRRNQKVAKAELVFVDVT